MGLSKYGVTVGCEHCECVSGDDTGRFDVVVPVSDRESGLHGTARLRCTVSATTHSVDLVNWRDAIGGPLQAGAAGERLREALRFVADRRICGNQRICPSRVVAIVAEQGRD